MREEFNLFVDVLREATEALDAHYFQVSVAELEDPIYRERVYCYELYHQLRCILPRRFPYVLAGEVDKTGHPIIHAAIGPYKPDLIVHEPGGMAGNLAVVEVKPANTSLAEFQEDLRHLRQFLDGAHYFGAVSLVYGELKDKRYERFRAEFEGIFQGVGEKQCLFLLHEGPGQPAHVVHAIP
jgi:hypothetical protein